MSHSRSSDQVGGLMKRHSCEPLVPASPRRPKRRPGHPAINAMDVGERYLEHSECYLLPHPGSTSELEPKPRRRNPMSRPDFLPNMQSCPKCEEVLDSDEFDFLGLIEELGNVARFRCHRCQTVFDTLPPSPSVEDFMRTASRSSKNEG